MTPAETLKAAADYMVRCRSLVAQLDQAPAIVRRSDQAVQARAVAVDSLTLVNELLKRLRPEIEAMREQAGGENVNGE